MSDTGAGASVRGPLLLAAGTLLLYLALGQRALHGLDSFAFLRQVEGCRLHNAQSPLFPPLAWLWSQALAALGVPLYEAMRALSAVGGALGTLGCWVAAAAFGLDRPRRALVAAAAASVPAVLQAATIVEIDALLFAAAALALVPFAALVRIGCWRHAALTGGCTLLAASLHGAGHLLALSLCGLQLLWGWPQRRLRATLPRALLLAAVHGSGTLLLGWWLGGTGQALQAGNTLELGLPLEFAPHVLLHELLLPYAPFCLLAPLAWRRPELRAALLGLGLCLAGYLAVTTMILGVFRSTGPELPQRDIVEHGAFLLGLAPLMSLLAVQALPGRWPWLAVALSLLSAIVQVRAHDWPADPAGYAAGYAELEARQPLYVIVADYRELAWIARRWPNAPCRTVAAIELEAASRAGPDGRPASAELFAVWFTVEAGRQRAAGRTLCVTERARARLEASKQPGLAQAARALATTHELQPLAAQGFAATAVLPR